MSYNDIDSPDYRDTNLGHMFDTPEDKEIQRLEEKLSKLLKDFKSQTVMWENALKERAEMMEEIEGLREYKLINEAWQKHVAAAPRPNPDPEICAICGHHENEHRALGRNCPEAIAKLGEKTIWLGTRFTVPPTASEVAWKTEAIESRDRIAWLEQQREIALNQCAAATVERDGADKVCENLRNERDRLLEERKALSQNVADAQRNEENILDLENARWQQRIDGIVSKYVPGIDGSGCDSGDPLDLTATELELGFGKMKETETAMKHMEAFLMFCPSAVIRYNEDPDVEDNLGMVPVGFSIRGDGCLGTFCVVDDSLQAVLLRDKAQTGHLAKGAYSSNPVQTQ